MYREKPLDGDNLVWSIGLNNHKFSSYGPYSELNHTFIDTINKLFFYNWSS